MSGRPAQIHNINENSISQWYMSLPPITRILLTTYLVTGLGIFLRILPVMLFVHSWQGVFRLPIPQVWRLMTNFCIVGAPSINYLFQLVWLVRYGAAYESARFGQNAADALVMLGVGMASILALDGLLPVFFRAMVHGPSLVFMLIYLWSRENPESNVSFFGVIKFKGQWLPFALMGIDMIQGASISADLAGILGGHVYYFLTEIYPSTTGRQLISTPIWLARWVHRLKLGTVSVQQTQSQHPSEPGFRAFSGRGRRLAD